MLKYVIPQDNNSVLIFEGTDIAWAISQGFTEQEVEESDIDGSWYLKGFAPMKSEEDKAQQEAERIAMLNLTRGDVFRGLLLAKGITKDQIAQMINAMPTTTQEEILKKELAKIDFEDALNFYRGVELINTIGQALGITSEQLDAFFESNDYTKLI